jgi:hypothetical protein
MSAASFNLLQGDPTTWGVPPVGKSFLGINLSGQAVIVNNNGSGGAVISPVVSAAPVQLPFVNNSGTTTITPSAGQTTAVVAVGGTARNVPIVLATAGMTDGMVLDLLLIFPALDNLIMNIYNTVGSGSPLDTVQSTTAGNLTTAWWRLLYTSANGTWSIISNKAPAVQF